MNAFTQDWSSENDWLVLASTLVSRVLSHMCDCKAVGSLIVHMWKSTYFRPLPCSDNAHLNFFEREWLFLSNESDLFTRGKVMDGHIVRYQGIKVAMFRASYCFSW